MDTLTHLHTYILTHTYLVDIQGEALTPLAARILTADSLKDSINTANCLNVSSVKGYIYIDS